MNTEEVRAVGDKNGMDNQNGMDKKNGFTVTNRDRVLRAWQNAVELVRDYQAYASVIGDSDPKLAKLFAEYAEQEALQASRLLELLQGYEQ